MGRISAFLSTRSRPDRARRRLVLLAESLESRQLLSVAATPMHAAIAPVANVPALVGPAVASPVANLSAGASSAASSAQSAVAIELGQFTVNLGNGVSETETVFLIEGFASNGFTAPSPAPVSSGSSSMGPVQSTPTSGSNSGGNASVSSGSSTSITPLTATILTGPSLANRAQIAVILAAPVSINLSPSTIPVTTQAILNTATLEEQPLQPPVLGQGFESGQTQGSLLPPEDRLRAAPAPVQIKPRAPATDYVEPYEAVPVNPAPGQPDQPAAPVNPPKVEGEAKSLESALLDPITSADWAQVVPQAATTPRLEGTVHDDAPSWSLATLVGTAAIASGGYQFVHGRSKRFNQRWLPTRRPERRSNVR